MATVQAAGGGVMMLGIFAWHTLALFLVPLEHCLNSTADLIIVVDGVLASMITVYLSCNGYFQLDNVPVHKALKISKWFLEHDSDCSQTASAVTRSQSK